MGTRGLIGHILRGRKKGSYNHFDSYPTELGVDILEFIKNLTDEELEEMKKMIDELEWVNDREPAPEALRQHYARFADLSVSTKSISEWFCLLRHTQGARCLPFILDGSLRHQIDNTEFEDDHTFCEWVYWIDWEKRELEVRNHSYDIHRNFSFADWSVERMKALNVLSDSDD